MSSSTEATAATSAPASTARRFVAGDRVVYVTSESEVDAVITAVPLPGQATNQYGLQYSFHGLPIFLNALPGGPSQPGTFFSAADLALVADSGPRELSLPEIVEAAVGRAVRAFAPRTRLPEQELEYDVELQEVRSLRRGTTESLKRATTREPATVLELLHTTSEQNEHLHLSLRRVTEVADRLCGGEALDGAGAESEPTQGLLGSARDLQQAHWRLLHELSRQVGRIESAIERGPQPAQDAAGARRER